MGNNSSTMHTPPSIGRAILAGFGLALIVLIVISATAFASIENLLDDVAAKNKSDKFLVELNHLFSDVQDAETGQRGYILTGDPRYLAPYSTAVSEIYQHLAELRVLAADDPDQLRRASLLHPLIDDKLAELGETIALRQTEGFEAAVEVVRTDRGQDLMDGIRRVVGEMQLVENARLEQRDLATARSTVWAERIILAGIVVAVAIVSLSSLVAYRGLVERQRAEAALQRAHADLEARVAARTADLAEINAALQAEIAVRNQAVQELRDSQYRFQALVENSTDVITMIGSDRKVMYASPAATRVLGFSSEEHVGQDVLDFVHPDDLEQAQSALAQILAQPGTSLLVELRAQHRDGSFRWLEGVATNLLAEPAVKSIVGNFRDATERKRAERLLERQVNRLEALRAIDTAITASMDVRLTLAVLLEQVTAQLEVDAAGVLLYNRHTQELTYAAGRGFRTSAIQHTRRHLGEGYAGRAALERTMVSVPDLPEAGDTFGRRAELSGEGFISYYGVPLVAKGELKGVLEIFHRTRLDPDSDWIGFLAALAGQAAIAVDNAGLLADIQRSNLELLLAYDSTIEGWSKALDLRDRESEGHSQRVTDMSVRLARTMGLPEKELVQVRRGALLHDMGKLGIPDNILLKPGKLSDEEWEIMRKHPTYAYEMLSQISYLRPALDIPYCHHEKWDGTGYPRGLKGEQIPLAARIFAVVDVWDALRSDRPYRKGWPAERVREHIRQQVGTHFDPQVVEAFLRMES